MLSLLLDFLSSLFFYAWSPNPQLFLFANPSVSLCSSPSSEQLRWRRRRRWRQLLRQWRRGPETVRDLCVAFAEFLRRSSERGWTAAPADPASVGSTPQIHPPVGPGGGQHRAVRLWRCGVWPKFDIYIFISCQRSGHVTYTMVTIPLLAVWVYCRQRCNSMGRTALWQHLDLYYDFWVTLYFYGSRIFQLTSCELSSDK